MNNGVGVVNLEYKVIVEWNLVKGLGGREKVVKGGRISLRE